MVTTEFKLGIKTNIVNRFSVCLNELMSIYREFALALNAFDVTARSYEARDSDFLINTIANLPVEYHVKFDTDNKLYSRMELVYLYINTLGQQITSTYLIRLVSCVDGCIEDIFELSTGFENSLSQNQVEKLIRNCWANEMLEKWLGKALSNGVRQNALKTILTRYRILRLIRHAIIHSKGVVDTDKITRFSEYSKESEDGFPFSIPGLITDKVITIKPEHGYVFRKELFDIVDSLEKLFLL